MSWEDGDPFVCDAICCSQQGLEQHALLSAVPPKKKQRVISIHTFERSRRSDHWRGSVPSNLFASNLRAVLGNKRHRLEGVHVLQDSNLGKCACTVMLWTAGTLSVHPQRD